MHSMTTTIMGIGIFSARMSDKHKVLRVILSILAAIAFHMSFNTLVQTKIGAVALVLPILVFIVLFVVLKKENLRKFLWDKEDAEEKEPETKEVKA